MCGISDWRYTEFDPSIREHDDEFRAAPQIEMREQMTDVLPNGNVLEPHFQGNCLGGKPAHQPRQCLELSGCESQLGRVTHF